MIKDRFRVLFFSITFLFLGMISPRLATTMLLRAAKKVEEMKDKK